jgi:hypothetical protein
VKRSQGRPRAKYGAAKRVKFRGADLVLLQRRQHLLSRIGLHGRPRAGSSLASFRQSGRYTRCHVTASTPKPEAGARCVSSARRDLCGGGEQILVPRPFVLLGLGMIVEGIVDTLARLLAFITSVARNRTEVTSTFSIDQLRYVADKLTSFPLWAHSGNRQARSERSCATAVGASSSGCWKSAGSRAPRPRVGSIGTS